MKGSARYDEKSGGEDEGLVEPSPSIDHHPITLGTSRFFAG
jgi:hypothetical protein